jgi:hypothetical protein
MQSKKYHTVGTVPKYTKDDTSDVTDNVMCCGGM